jgi:two-component system, NtrC family, response regulator AtoC
MIRPRLLIVDDEEDIRTSFADHFLARLNCELDVRSNGAEAIRDLDSREYHALLLDLHMPGVDGLTVLTHAKKKYPGIITLVITRLDDPAKTKAVEDLGAIYVSKPVTLKALQFILERELDRKGCFQYKKTG